MNNKQCFAVLFVVTFFLICGYDGINDVIPHYSPNVAMNNTLFPLEKKNNTLQEINHLKKSLEKKKIILQEIKKMKKSNKTYQSATILVWGFSYFLKSPSTLNCYPYQCIVTKNKRQLNNSAAVLFDQNFVKYNEGPATKPINQKWVFSSREPVPYHKVSQTLDKTINLKFTYHNDTDVYLGWGFYFPYGEYSWLPYYIPPKSTPEGKKIFAELERDTEEQHAINARIRRGVIKTKLALWLVGNCKSKLRTLYGRKLMQTGIQIDKFGHCGMPDPCRSKQNKICLQKMGEKYKFYIAFENNICKDYITEKSWLYLRRGMVPVALGADVSTYEKVLPPNSFLHINNFTSVNALAEYLKYLDKNEDAYQRYHEWRKHYQVIYLGGDFMPLIRCDLCWNIFQPTKPTYKSIKDWYKC